MRPLPDTLTGPAGAALLQLLEPLRTHVGETGIDRLWIFPAEPGRPAPGGVLVASVFEPDAGERRRVFTSHFVRRVEPGVPPRPTVEVMEHGTAPIERLDRLIEGVLRRVDEGPASRPPHLVELEGDAARWTALIGALGGEAAGVTGS